MKFVNLFLVCALVFGFAGCINNDKTVDATTKIDRPLSDHCIKITICDETAKLIMEKTVKIPNYSYNPSVEVQKDGTILLRWYEGGREGGICVLKPGWIASWEKIPNQPEAPSVPLSSPLPSKGRNK